MGLTFNGLSTHEVHGIFPFVTVFEFTAAVFWVTGLRSSNRFKSCVKYRAHDGVEIGGFGDLRVGA